MKVCLIAWQLLLLVYVAYGQSQGGMTFHTKVWTTANGVPNSMSQANSIYNALPTQYFDPQHITKWNRVYNRLFASNHYQNIAYKMSAVFFVTKTKDYTIRWGVDGTYGGGMSMDGVTISERWNQDMWYAGRWTNPTQYHSGTVRLTAGRPHSLLCYAFERCCDGPQELMVMKQDEQWVHLASNIIDGDNIINTSWPYPIVDLARPPTIATHGQPIITITGSFFTTTRGSVTIGGKACLPITYWQDDYIECQAPIGAGQNQKVQVISSGTQSSDEYSPGINYEPPTITGLTSLWSTKSDQQDIVVVGANFGLHPTATITGANSPASEDVTFKSINLAGTVATFRNKAGYGAGMVFRLSVGGQVASEGFTYNPPSITNIYPSSFYTGSNNVLTLQGSNFYFSNSASSINTLTVDKYQSNCNVTVDNTEIECQLDARLQGVNLPLLVNVGGQGKLASETINYNNPVVEKVNNKNSVTVDTSENNVLSITGKSFGTQLVLTKVVVGRYSCAVQTVTHLLITCILAAGVGGSNRVVVTVGSLASSEDVFVSRNAPVVSNVATLNALNTIGGGELVIDVDDAGTNKDLVSVLIKTSGSYKDCPVLKVTLISGDTGGKIYCAIPAGSLGIYVTLTVSGQKSVVKGPYYPYRDPEITHVLGDLLKGGGSDQITVRGHNFGIIGVAYFAIEGEEVPNAFPCSTVGKWGHAKFVCTYPPARRKQAYVYVVLGEGPAAVKSQKFVVEYEGLSLEHIEPRTGNTKGGEQIAIYGDNFGKGEPVGYYLGDGYCSQRDQNDSGISQQFNSLALCTAWVANNTACGNFFDYSHTQLSCNCVPVNAVQCTLEDDTDQYRSFKLVRAAVKINDQNVKINDGGWFNELIQVVTPSGGGKNVAVEVIATHGNITKNMWSHDAPLITSFSPLTGPTKGGVSITAYGENFDEHTVIKIGDTASEYGTSNTDRTQLVFQLPAGSGKNKQVQVLASEVSNEVDCPKFTYANPVVTGVDSLDCEKDNAGVKDCPFDTSYNITITGYNFGASKSHVSIAVTLTDSSGTTLTCTSSTVSHMQIICTLPSNPSGGAAVPMVVTVDSLPSAEVQLISWAGPAFQSNNSNVEHKEPNDQVMIKVTSFCDSSSKAIEKVIVKFGDEKDSFSNKKFHCNVTSIKCNTPQTLTCTLPPGLGQGHVFQAQVGDQISGNSEMTLAYQKPRIISGTLREVTATDPANPISAVNVTSPATAAPFKFDVANWYLRETDSQGFVKYMVIEYVGSISGNIHKCVRPTMNPAGTYKKTWIQCYTEAAKEDPTEPFNFRITTIGGLTSDLSEDAMKHPTPPEVHNVTAAVDSGCTVQDEALIDCPTEGWVRITIKGDHFTSTQLKTLTIGGVSSSIVSYDPEQITAMLPPGSGFDLDVVVNTNSFYSISSKNSQLISYKKAIVSKLSVGWDVFYSATDCQQISKSKSETLADCTSICEQYPNCNRADMDVVRGECTTYFGCSHATSGTAQADKYTLLRNRTGTCELESNNLTTCQRQGNEVINIIGTDFGVLPPLILVCEKLCSNVTILKGHQMVSCEIPEGTSAENNINVVQRQGGQLSNGPNMAYAQCQPGQFGYSGSVTVCDSCQPGKFSSSQGVLQCEDCEVGKYSDTGKSVCSKCGVGEYADKSGQMSCDRCSPGTAVSTTGNSRCLDCEPGFFINTTGNAMCDSCAPGMFQKDSGKTVCAECSAGRYYANQAASTCTQCELGTYCNETKQTSCMSCPSGTKSEGVGLDSCADCPVGRQQPQIEQSFCETCPAGTYAEITATATCVPCAAGKYSESGWSSCKNCTTGTYAGEGAGICSQCEVGKFGGSPGLSECTHCQKGTANSIPGETTCRSCNTGYYTSETKQITCEPCKPGQYQNQTGRQQCIPCFAGTYTNTLGSKVCLLCQSGEYQNEQGQYECKDCTPGKYSPSPGARICTKCEQGKSQAQSKQSQCNSCESGTFQDADGQELCKDCKRGTAQPSTGSTSCDSCEAGFEAPNPKSSTCTACAGGKYANLAGFIECASCKAGSHSPQDPKLYATKSPTAASTEPKSILECTTCPVGTYQEALAGTTCRLCENGKFAGYGGQTACTECAIGRFAPISETVAISGALECKQAEIGAFTNVTGAISQYECGFGEYQPEPGQSTCLACEAGRITFEKKSGRCNPCLAGTYQERSSASSCNSCLPGFYSEAGSAVCTKCFARQVAPNKGTARCDTCPNGADANKERTRCMCKAGFYARVPPFTCKNNAAPTNAAPTNAAPTNSAPTNAAPTNGAPVPTNAAPTSRRRRLFSNITTSPRAVDDDTVGLATQCVECDRGMDCKIVGLLYEEVPVLPGYWEKEYPDPDNPGQCKKVVEQCLKPSDCLGGERLVVDKATGQREDHSRCAEYRTGDLCAVCLSNTTFKTFETVGGSCKQCTTAGSGQLSSEAYFVLFILSSIVAVSVIYGIVIYNSNKLIRAASLEDEIRKKLQAGFVVEGDDTVLADYYRHGDIVTIFGSPAPRPNFMYKLKIALGFVQILSSVILNWEITLPTNFKNFIGIFNIFRFDFLAGASVDCIVSVDFIDKFWILAASPFVAVLGVALLFLLPQYIFHVGNNEVKIVARKAARQRFWSLVMFTLFLVYPNCASNVFRLFQCKKVYGKWYLRADFNINCVSVDEAGATTRWGYTWPPGLVVVAIVPIGIPAFMFYMLWRYRGRLEELGVRAELGFLYGAYEPHLWWWELADMGHKVLIVGLVPFISDKRYLVPTGCCVAFSYLFLILVLKPYLLKADDRVMQFAQTEIILILLAAYWMQTETDLVKLDELDIYLSIVLIAACFLFFSIFLVGLVYSLKKVFMMSSQGKALSAWVYSKTYSWPGALSWRKRQEKKRLIKCRGDGRKKGVGEEFYEGIQNLEFKAKVGVTATSAFDPFESNHFKESLRRNPLQDITKTAPMKIKADKESGALVLGRDSDFADC